MVKSADTTLVFLTYNNKILLLLRDNRMETTDLNTWGFIGGSRNKYESSEETTIREVEESTGLQLLSVKLLTTLVLNDRRKFVYHAALTSGNLNEIRRDEYQNLDFFSLPEVEKLSLEEATKTFLLNHRETIQGILHAEHTFD